MESEPLGICWVMSSASYLSVILLGCPLIPRQGQFKSSLVGYGSQGCRRR